MDQQPFRNPYLCLTIVWFLGASAVISLLGIITMGVLNREPPSALIAIASGSMGSLGSFLVSPPRGSAGFDARQGIAPQQYLVTPQGDGHPRALPPSPPQAKEPSDHDGLPERVRDHP